MRWKVFSGALNARLLIGFMKRLVHGRQKRILLVLDNLRVHHSKAVKKWLKENVDKIEVFYLPSYSPELNPDELLNADLKQRVTKTAPARTKLALTHTAIGALRSIQKQPERVESYFEHKDVCYDAAQQCLWAGSIKWWAGRCSPICSATWSSMHWRWLGSSATQARRRG
jgi:transposase